MSFTDLMSSGRGPGVVGMLMALFVLVGFGVLFVFAFDEEMQGGDQSIESIIARQAREIEDTKWAISQAEGILGDSSKLVAITKEYAGVRRENQYREGQIESLKQSVARANSAIAEQTVAWEAYKDDYRTFVRNAAKGRKIDRIETRAGKVYINVSVSKVTAIGMQIRHDGGIGRIPFEELPGELQDEFQFDAEQKAAAVDRERTQRIMHEAAVLEAGKRASERKQNAANAAVDETIRSIAVIESRIISLNEEIELLEKDIQIEVRKKFSRAPQMRRSLESRKRLLSTLQADVARLRKQL